MKEFSNIDVNRFLSRLKRVNDCLIWQGKGQEPYSFNFADTKSYAKNFAWFLKHRSDVPDTMQLTQSCGDERCMNPAHLKLTKRVRRVCTPTPSDDVVDLFFNCNTKAEPSYSVNHKVFGFEYPCEQ